MKRIARAGFAPNTGNKQTDALFLRTKTKHPDIKKRAKKSHKKSWKSTGDCDNFNRVIKPFF